MKLQELLKDELGLEPVVVQDAPNQTIETILSKIERLADDCQSAIVLMTPDDDTHTGKRARQNVILELGYFLGRFRGNSMRRIVVIKHGDVEIPSDISGVIYMEFFKNPDELHLKLKKQFAHWGYQLKP
jgi:predicted nucleotide-binding protein